MKITYELELEDFFIFSNYLIKTSPLMHKIIRKGQLWWACSPLAAGLVLSILRGYSSERTLIILSVLSMTISLPLFFLYKLYFIYQNKKHIKTLYKNDSYKNILGAHEMIISDDQLIEKSEGNENNIQWNSINKIITTADHTFIFTDDITAYVIAHKKITSGNTSQFNDKLNSTFKKFTGSPQGTG